MRIRPDFDPVAVLTTLPATSARGSGFDSALASVQGAGHPDTASTEHVTPLAERWGEYGQGARPEGFGPPPDPSIYAAYPVGADEAAHPLNPGGYTYNPAPLTIPGYTGRGTPIPPGFYNIAYYERYLREGGTPLEGFAERAAGSSLSDAYGQFGDGRARAISFVPTPVADPGSAGDTAAEGGAATTASSAAALDAGRAAAIASPSLAAPSRAPANAEPAVAVAAPAADGRRGATGDALGAPASAVAEQLRAALAGRPDQAAVLRVEIEHILSDLVQAG